MGSLVTFLSEYWHFVAAVYLSLYIVKLPHIVHATRWIVATKAHLHAKGIDTLPPSLAPLFDVDDVHRLQSTVRLFAFLVSLILLFAVPLLLVRERTRYFVRYSEGEIISSFMPEFLQDDSGVE